MQDKRVYPDGKRIRDLRLKAGLTQKQLAHAAGFGKRTIEYAEKGRRLQRATLECIATALAEALKIACPGARLDLEKSCTVDASPDARAPLNVLFHIPGDPGNLQQSEHITRGLAFVEDYARKSPHARVVAVVGVESTVRATPDAITIIHGQPALPRVNPDDFARVIILIYGVLENDVPFWCYVAVKPSSYSRFLAAQNDGSVDLYHFDPFGEVIVSGEGHEPPEAVTLKIAEVYQVDRETFFEPVDPAAEIEKRIKCLEEKRRLSQQPSSKSTEVVRQRG